MLKASSRRGYRVQRPVSSLVHFAERGFEPCKAATATCCTRDLIGADSQIDVARFYDVPFLSLQNPLAHPDRIPQFYGRDYGDGGAPVNTRHPGHRGHFAMGNIILHHLLTELDTMIRESALEFDPEETKPPEHDDITVADDSVLSTTLEEFEEWRVDDFTEYQEETQWGSELFLEDVPRVCQSGQGWS
jgi:hypothetical protein